MGPRPAAGEDPYSRRSGPVAFTLRYGGLLLVVAGLSDLVFDWATALTGLEFPWSLGAQLASIGLGGLAILLSGRFDAPSAAEVLRRDPRPPVLYLRSFTEDRSFASPSGLELQMRFGLSLLGPVVALGRPGDRMPIVGVPRLYSPHADWEDWIRQWLGQAALVVIRAGSSEGLDWELGEVGRSVAPQRIVVIPTHSKNVWNEFVDHFPLPLPRQLQGACLVYFRSASEPVTLRHPRPHTRPGQTDKEWYECHEIWAPIVEQVESLADPG